MSHASVDLPQDLAGNSSKANFSKNKKHILLLTNKKFCSLIKHTNAQSNALGDFVILLHPSMVCCDQ